MNPDVQKQKERFLKVHAMKNLSLKAVDHCIKDYETVEISEEETECLRVNTLKLYYITQKNPLSHLVYENYPKI